MHLSLLGHPEPIPLLRNPSNTSHVLDVLNRFPNPSDRTHVIHILKYMFPRQFNLHNVFTSTVDRKETIQPLKDYTLREHEIALQGGKGSFIPKRLKGKTFDLVQRMMRLHKRCSYHALIEYYCPVWVLLFFSLTSPSLGWHADRIGFKVM